MARLTCVQRSPACAGAAAFSFFFYLLFVPETNGLPLEAITPLFENPAKLVKSNLATAKQGTFLQAKPKPAKAKQ